MKLVLVGDGSVGKTCMLISYTSDCFPTDYVPTVFDNYEAKVKCLNKMIKLSLCDTAGQEEYERIRPLTYTKADVFLICFSMMDNTSLDNAIDKWLVEIEENVPDAEKVFVGTKSDLRVEHDYMCQENNEKS